MSHPLAMRWMVAVRPCSGHRTDRSWSWTFWSTRCMMSCFKRSGSKRLFTVILIMGTLMLLVARRARVVPVAVSVADGAVRAMDHDVRLLVLRDRHSGFDGLVLSWVNARGLGVASA